MSHECEDCGQAFDTLTRLRLHDCESSSETTTGTPTTSDPDDGRTTPSDRMDRQPDPIEVDDLETAFDQVGEGDPDPLYRALATYESELTAASESDASARYRGVRRAYRKRLINHLDQVTRESGWSVLETLIDAYHPSTAGDFPQVTTILQNVTARACIRTRLADGVAAIPVDAVDYFETIRTEIDAGYDYVIEGLHPYGWAIGHPEVDVEQHLHDHASKDIFSTNPMLEHAFYADQHAAIEVLEAIAHDESIQETISRRINEQISEVRYLLDAVAGAASDEYWPTVPRYWDWPEELDYEFDLDPDVERRIRKLVTEQGLDADLPENWEITVLTI